MIHVKNVWKKFDTLIAVRDFSVHIKPADTFGLIGPNGSGKTTLLRMISTLAKPDVGSIEIHGLDNRLNACAVRKRIAFMPAEFGFPQNMTIAEYMEYFACALGVPRRERRRAIADVLTLTDLQERREVIIRGLSTGNKQRVLLAKTLIGDPEILILDEPASGLDPRARAEIRMLLKELSAMGKTIILSSHILADLEDICDTVCIIELGEKVLAGSLNELRAKYANVNRIVRLRVPDAVVGLACALLKKNPRVLSCDIIAGQLEVASREENCNFILRLLLDAEVEIFEMREEKPDLEGIFMASTKGLVS